MPNLDTPQLIALAGALGWASGLRLYLVVLLTGLAGFMGWVTLPQGLHLLSNPAVLGANAAQGMGHRDDPIVSVVARPKSSVSAVLGAIAWDTSALRTIRS